MRRTSLCAMLLAAATTRVLLGATTGVCPVLLVATRTALVALVAMAVGAMAMELAVMRASGCN